MKSTGKKNKDITIFQKFRCSFFIFSGACQLLLKEKLLSPPAAAKDGVYGLSIQPQIKTKRIWLTTALPLKGSVAQFCYAFCEPNLIHIRNSREPSEQYKQCMSILQVEKTNNDFRQKKRTNFTAFNKATKWPTFKELSESNEVDPSSSVANATNSRSNGLRGLPRDRNASARREYMSAFSSLSLTVLEQAKRAENTRTASTASDCFSTFLCCNVNGKIIEG